MKKNKKKQTKKELNIRQDIRHLGVLVERVNDDVKLVAEQYGDIKKDTNTIKTTLNSHTEMIGDLMIGLEIVKEDLGIVKGDVKTTKIDIEIIKTDIELIKNSIKKKIDIDEFAALEKRVLLLEKRR